VADLFTSLGMAARSLEAQRFALDATGQNIANVNTPGYTRRVVDFAAIPPTSPYSAGGGVTVQDLRSQRDLLLERRLQQETTAASREDALADALGVAEVALTSPGALDQRLNDFFDSFARLADSPMSPVARQEVTLQGSNLASAVRQTYEGLAQSRRAAPAAAWTSTSPTGVRSSWGTPPTRSRARRPVPTACSRSRSTDPTSRRKSPAAKSAAC
jgi:flagellar hook-associated protein 1 FlgK